MKTLFTLFLMTFLMSSLTAQTIISQGSVWKYLDDGSNQDTSWYGVNYVDTAWSQGAGQLGYGDGDETTVLSYGNSSSNKHITYYFRKTFSTQNVNNINGFGVGLLRDDGAVVYLNGVELFRSNMPTGTITYTTKAAHTVAGVDEDTYFVYEFPASLLNNGQNLLAVEVHQRTGSSSDMSFDLEMNYTDISNFRKAPYLLYPGENTKMLIYWQLRDSADCIFKWGTDTTYTGGSSTTQEINNSHQHSMLLTNLTPGTKYYYQVIYDSTEFKKGSFVSGVPTTKQSLTFYAYGDTRTQPDKHNDVAEAIMTDMAADPVAQTFIVSSGDIVADGDQEGDWDQQLFDDDYVYLQQLLANLPYLAAVGNHEGQGILFAKYFPYPMFVSGKYYYSFDYGPVHFTILDQYDDLSSSSAQYTWLVNDLAGSSKPWKIILLHKPGWSAAGGHSNSGTVQTLIQPLCLQYGVQFILAGHNHYYARASANGVQHITTGGGGAPLYTPDPNMDSIVTVDKSYHFCKLEIDHDTLLFSAIRSDGSLIESIKYDRNYALGLENEKQMYNPTVNVYASAKSIFVHTDEMSKAKVEVFDNIGRLVISKEMNGTDIKINIAQSGVYYVRYSQGSDFIVKKVMLY